MKELLTGNQALALGALQAGVEVVTGYPGTPSTGALTSLLKMTLPGRHVEWSVNEKVAFEIATGASWAGKRALCTMKMSGVNVAYDSLISVAYSGCIGGLVIYVADDPGVSAGMAEQDTRGYALMSDLPLLEPSSVAEAYRLIQTAFELSERVGTPVFFRLVTALSQSKSPVEVAPPPPPPEREPRLVRDITRFTKAGAAICQQQHCDLLARLERAGQVIREMGLNRLEPAAEPGGVGVIASGVAVAYLDEVIAGADLPTPPSVLRVAAPHPFPEEEVRALLRHCETVLVLEELEPHLERGVYVTAQRMGFTGRIVGKLDGTLSRIGEYTVAEVRRGLREAGIPLPESPPPVQADHLAAARPITVCAGCPHRGTYMAINQALKNRRLKRDEVLVTGDIGCTILGMNPPFNTVWTEIAMGASLGLAQGYVRGGVRTPVIATIGDSTFFHAGMPGLVNAIQHQCDLTLIVMDNGWTSMTGMQVSPGTAAEFQRPGDRRIDLARLIPALGVEQFFVVDPFDLEGTTAVIQRCLDLPGVKVVLARQECAIQALRRGVRVGRVAVVPERCTLCKQCIRITGCPAIGLGPEAITIDQNLCNGCGLCAQVCPFEAIVRV